MKKEIELQLKKPSSVALRYSTGVYANSRNPYNNSLSAGGYDLFLSIKTKREIDDNLLISSFIMFMTTYFYICDVRQKNIVAKALKEAMELQAENGWSYFLYTRVVEQSLSEQERKYASEIFTNGGYDKNIPYGIPPLDYNLERYSGSRLFRAAKYDFYITKTNNRVFDNFFMTMGNDIVLLPITIGMMQKAISDRISEAGRKTLYKCILDFLEKYNAKFSKIELVDLANKVLTDNQIKV